jgi:hypothetical protein
MAPRPDLQRSVLADPRVTLEACGRRAIRAGRVDRRILAVIEYLSYSGLSPDVAGLPCPAPSRSRPTPDMRFYLTQVGGVLVAGHQQKGGLVDLTIRQLLALQGALRPSRIVSLLRYPLEPAAVTRPGAAARIEVDFEAAQTTALGSLPDALDTTQWKRLIRRLVRLSGP